MNHFAWVTDPHLNFLDPPEVEAFLRSVANLPADGLLLTGDIGEAGSVTAFLKLLDARLGRPVYFVLGNHDFYRGSIAGVREQVAALCRARRNLCWLPRAGVIPLTESTALVGHDGWGDGRYGDYWGLRVRLNDWAFIAEFAGLDEGARLAELQRLGDEAAAHFQAVVPEALANFRHVVVLTHVPPFREACWHEGHISDDDYLPHFACKAAGDVLVELMRAHPDQQMTVLCGHTHGAGEAQVLPNLRVLTGGAEYGKPKVQQVLELE
jgi:3',5'-cyclic AMP phosphodiesterase CpdA